MRYMAEKCISNMDFTLERYSDLLAALAATYRFMPCGEYPACCGTPGKRVYLRHDVDRRPDRSLEVAKLENGLGVRSSFYFRSKPCSWDERVIREISGMGHEIGFHYESLVTCDGDVDAAYDDFCRNLEKLRSLAPVRTICMHGSPSSRFDNRDIWKKYDYHSLGICLEPYLDTDWSNCFYLTDTGRRWDGYKVSVRDKVPHWQDVWTSQGLVFHGTRDIIAAAECGALPSELMLTTHPQRWTRTPVPWLRELICQNAKNAAKRVLVSIKQ